jgi:hypothetical protein
VALLGLISSSYSTLSQFAAARVGRDAAIDWMSVAAIPARGWALQSGADRIQYLMELLIGDRTWRDMTAKGR